MFNVAKLVAHAATVVKRVFNRKPAEAPAVVVRGFKPEARPRKAKVVKSTWPNWALPLAVIPVRPHLTTARMRRLQQKKLRAARRAAKWEMLSHLNSMQRCALVKARLQAKWDRDPAGN